MTNDRTEPQSPSQGMQAYLTYGPFAGGAVALVAFLYLDVAAKSTLLAVAAMVAGCAGVALSYLSARAQGERIKAEADSRVIAIERENTVVRAQNSELESFKRESDTILGSVRAHLMLIDSSYRIQTRYSNELENVFHQNDLANENFLNVLQRMLSDRMFKTARDYLALLFDASKKERTVLKVNPLDEVEVNVINPDRSTGLKYLTFTFRRIVENDQIVKVLVSVEDTTDRTILERQLRESEQRKVKQFELLIGILHVDPKDLDGFVAMANEQLSVVDDALKASDFATATVGQTALLRQRLDVVLQRVHNIKGNASLLRLEHFEKQAQEFEQRIFDLKHRQALGGDDFLTVVIALAEFRSDLDDLQVLRTKLVGIQRSVQIREEVGDPLVQSVTELAQQLGNKLGKPVKVDADGFDSRRLPPEQRLVVKDVLIQLARNSLAHGIESPNDRLAARKPPVATIDIHPSPEHSSDVFAFTYRDDGRGLDAVKIRERAVAAGLLDSSRASSVEDSEIAGFIFAPGFSTADSATLESGRGMGMNVVKQRIVDDCGGEIGVSSETGRYCEFSFALPAHSPATATSR